KFTIDDLKELYHAHWGIETAFRHKKTGGTFAVSRENDSECALFYCRIDEIPKIAGLGCVFREKNGVPDF
ncbi:MAG: hypothetical protein IJF67_13440, partial [Clostridia bacterium]|nr:hypothetical protein [Clostridia bacterium]